VDRAVAGSNVQKRGGHVNVHGRIGLPLRATFERGKDMNVHGWAGSRAVAGSNMRRGKNTLMCWLGLVECRPGKDT
jgi:hypothetical protein